MSSLLFPNLLTSACHSGAAVSEKSLGYLAPESRSSISISAACGYVRCRRTRRPQVRAFFPPGFSTLGIEKKPIGRSAAGFWQEFSAGRASLFHSAQSAFSGHPGFRNLEKTEMTELLMFPERRSNLQSGEPREFGFRTSCSRDPCRRDQPSSPVLEVEHAAAKKYAPPF